MRGWRVPTDLRPVLAVAQRAPIADVSERQQRATTGCHYAMPEQRFLSAGDTERPTAAGWRRRRPAAQAASADAGAPRPRCSPRPAGRPAARTATPSATSSAAMSSRHGRDAGTSAAPSSLPARRPAAGAGDAVGGAGQDSQAPARSKRGASVPKLAVGPGPCGRRGIWSIMLHSNNWRLP